MIPPGMRAVAVRVNEVVGVAGFVVAGMHVDVLISGNRPERQRAAWVPSRKTLLQNIEVLSAGQDFKKDAEGKPVMVQVVNLLVTPKQAEQLSLAASQTSIQLVLRNPLDHDIAKTPGTALAASLRQWQNAAAASIGNVTASAQRTAASHSGACRGAARPAQGSAVRDGDHLRDQESGNRNSTERRRANKCPRLRIASVLLAATAVWLWNGPASRAGGDDDMPRSPRKPASPAAPGKLMVTVGKFLIIDSPLNIQRISVANGELVEAVAVNPKEVLINGKARAKPR